MQRAESVQHGQVKYLSNQLEADHGTPKRLTNQARGFKTLQTASATIKCFAAMRMIRIVSLNVV
jgi:transposase-like protein